MCLGSYLTTYILIYLIVNVRYNLTWCKAVGNAVISSVTKVTKLKNANLLPTKINDKNFYTSATIICFLTTLTI